MVPDFKEATDDLLATYTHNELAQALSVSVATIRQARLEGHAKAHRSPPDGWEGVVSALAKRRAKRLLRLVVRLQKAKKSRSNLG